MSKLDSLLSMLRAGHTVTRATAFASLKLANLPAAISQLRAKGFNIRAKTSDDGSGTGATYTRWTIHPSQRAKKGKPTKGKPYPKGSARTASPRVRHPV